MKSSLQERPPIVAVLGHVDHGKSTLLDFIRKSNTVAHEAGGITQHVAAYEVEHVYQGEKKRITFIDTPGHAAFQAIRARGAKIADIAILVVAADDGVKAQTLEALESIRQAGIPFVVAINKIDTPNADLTRTQTSLIEHGVYLEKLGGEVPWAAISAKTGQGVDELLDLILIVAELQEMKADPHVLAEGYVVEAHRDQKRGIAATLIITNGTLKKGMAALAASAVAPVRLMEDHTGRDISSASFSTPVTLVGFDELPQAGAAFKSFKTKKEAEAARPLAAPQERASEATAQGKFLFPVILRADAAGSLEAIEHEVAKLGDRYRGITLVQEGIGDVSENDIKAAIAAGVKAVLGFNVSIDDMAQALAHQNGIRFETFTIIYKLTERLQALLIEMAPKRTEEVVVGRAKIIKVFSSRHDEHLIGGRVQDGALKKKATIRLNRRGEHVAVGEILSMQSAKRATEKVEAGNEFGAQVVLPEEPREGDTLECIEIRSV